MSSDRVMTWSSGLNIYKVNKLRTSETSSSLPKLDPLEFLVSRNLLHVAEYVFECVGMEDTSTSCLLVSKNWFHFLSSHIMARWADKLLSLDPALANLLVVQVDENCDDLDEKAMINARRLCLRSGRLREVWAHSEPRTRRLMCDSFVLSVCCHDNDLVCGLNSGALQLWKLNEINNKNCIKEREVHAKGIKCLARGGSEGWLASGSYDCTAKIWSWDTWNLLYTVQVHADSVWDLSFHEDILATAGLDGCVGVFRIHNNDDNENNDDNNGDGDQVAIDVNLLCLIQTGQSDIVSGVDLLWPWLATAHEDSRLSLWQMTDTDYSLHRELRGHGGGVTAVRLVFHKGSKLVLFSASYDGSVRIWSVDANQCALILSQPCNFVRCLDVHNEIVVAGDFGGNTHIWSVDLDQMKLRYHRCLSAHKGHVVSVHLDAAKVITGSRDKSVLVQDFLALLHARPARVARHGRLGVADDVGARARRRLEQRRALRSTDNRVGRGWMSPFWRY